MKRYAILAASAVPLGLLALSCARPHADAGNMAEQRRQVELKRSAAPEPNPAARDGEPPPQLGAATQPSQFEHRDLRVKDATFRFIEIVGVVGENRVKLTGVTLGGLAETPGDAARSGTAIDEPVFHNQDVPKFYMLETEVTRAQWKAVMGSDPDPSIFRRVDDKESGDLPVNNVTWHQAVRFCLTLSRMDGRTYRLPTEYEWEAAACGARGGNALVQVDYGARCTAETVADVRNGPSVARGGPGTDRPNSYGLYGMLGNVSEWTATPTWPANWARNAWTSATPQQREQAKRLAEAQAGAPRGSADVMSGEGPTGDATPGADNPVGPKPDPFAFIGEIVDSQFDRCDWWSYYRPEWVSREEGTQPRQSAFYVVRGGDFAVPAAYCTPNNRNGQPTIAPFERSHIGFRVVLQP